MKKHKTFGFLLAVIALAATVAAGIAALVVYREKRLQDEEELDRYLDSAIQ